MKKYILMLLTVVIMITGCTTANNENSTDGEQIGLTMDKSTETEMLGLQGEKHTAEVEESEMNEMEITAMLAKIYQAEDAILEDVEIFSDNRFVSDGNGYVGDFSADYSSVTFAVDVPVAGEYDIVISSTTIKGWGYKYNSIMVNGSQAGEIATPDDGAFTETSLNRVYMEKGVNEITFLKSWGWSYLDYLYIKPSQDLSVDAYNVTAELINPNADENAKRLMKYIVDIYGKKILSGQYDSVGINGNDFKAIYSVTGKYPAIMGLDMIDYSPSRVEHGANSKTVESAIEWHNMGGIVTFCWHWNAPKDLIDDEDHKWWSGFYTNATTFNLEKAMDKTDEEGYNLLIRDIDAIAEQLKRLQDAGVPVLWRPLHEASGGWFWWGASGSEPYKELWKLLYERLTLYHGLNNLIWVWNGQNKDWFPGAEYVDIVGEDIYAKKQDYSPQTPKFYEIVEYLQDLETMKVIGLTENGVVPDVELMVRDKAMWFMFATWNGDFVRTNTGKYTDEYTEASQLKKMYDDERVITLDELPDLKNYPLHK